jgi:glycosyltransferase involved in cell wall biosynthesis
MNIAFDAKRAYQNRTGLGHYSRTLVSSLAEYFPQHEYFLFAPKHTELYKPIAKNIHTISPRQFPCNRFRGLWRSNWVKSDLLKHHIHLYHGLSHEIPVGIHKTGIRSVVTVHDLIFERYPHQYALPDILIHRHKIKYACKHADLVIAISKQTKADLIELYKVPAEKIRVCYQSCNPAFAQIVAEEEKQMLKKKYGLPERFFLYVGSIIERKNLLNICKAMSIIKNEINIPLVVIGEGKKYKELVKKYLAESGLQQHVIFLSENPAAKADRDFYTAKNFPAIYQSALCMIYPSICEGFGIPVLEALWSNTPVITSNLSCLPETGGDAAYYVDPFKPEEMAEGFRKIVSDPQMVASMKQKGILHAQKFTQQECAASVMKVYEEIKNEKI